MGPAGETVLEGIFGEPRKAVGQRKQWLTVCSCCQTSAGLIGRRPRKVADYFRIISNIRATLTASTEKNKQE